MKIRYKLAELKARVAGLGTSYIGQIIHNQTLDMWAMAERYASKYRMNTSVALSELSRVEEYIASEMSQGNRLCFKSFFVGLKMTGRFERANEIYSHDDNPIHVVMTPKKSLHKVTRSLEPFCETARTKPWISSVAHHRITGEEPTRLDVICLDGGLTTINAYHCKVNPKNSDEGVWLTSADGATRLLAAAEIRENTEATCDVVFPASDLPPGEYRIEIRSRGKDTNPLVVASRKIEVER